MIPVSAALLAAVETASCSALVIGSFAFARWLNNIGRKLDRVLGIVAPGEDPKNWLDRRVEALEAAHAAHIAWHAGSDKPPLPTIHG